MYPSESLRSRCEDEIRCAGESLGGETLKNKERENGRGENRWSEMLVWHLGGEEVLVEGAGEFGPALRSSRPANREPKQRLPTRGSCCGRSGLALPLGPGIILTASYISCSSSSWQERIEWCILTIARYREIFPNKQKPLLRVSHRFQVRVITKASIAEQNKLVKSSAKKSWILWNSQEVEKASRVTQFKVAQQPGNLGPSLISWVHVRSYGWACDV